MPKGPPFSSVTLWLFRILWKRTLNILKLLYFFWALSGSRTMPFPGRFANTFDVVHSKCIFTFININALGISFSLFHVSYEDWLLCRCFLFHQIFVVVSSATFSLWTFKSNVSKTQTGRIFFSNLSAFSNIVVVSGSSGYPPPPPPPKKSQPIDIFFLFNEMIERFQKLSDKYFWNDIFE